MSPSNSQDQDVSDLERRTLVRRTGLDVVERDRVRRAGVVRESLAIASVPRDEVEEDATTGDSVRSPVVDSKLGVGQLRRDKGETRD